MRFYIVCGLTFFALCFFNLDVHSQDLSKANAKISAVRSVYDGDTFRADIDGVGKYLPVRVAGIDTPEIKGRCADETQLALKARDVTASLLMSAKVIELQKLRRGYYGRIVAEVWIDGDNLAAILLRRGLARQYDRRVRQKWC